MFFFFSVSFSLMFSIKWMIGNNSKSKVDLIKINVSIDRYIERATKRPSLILLLHLSFSKNWFNLQNVNIYGEYDGQLPNKHEQHESSGKLFIKWQFTEIRIEIELMFVQDTRFIWNTHIQTSWVMCKFVNVKQKISLGDVAMMLLCSPRSWEEERNISIARMLTLTKCDNVLTHPEKKSSEFILRLFRLLYFFSPI